MTTDEGGGMDIQRAVEEILWKARRLRDKVSELHPDPTLTKVKELDSQAEALVRALEDLEFELWKESQLKGGRIESLSQSEASEHGEDCPPSQGL